MNNDYELKEKDNIIFNSNFPRMLWLGDQGLFEKALFIKDLGEFFFLMDELTYAIRRNNYSSRRNNYSSNK